MSRNLHMGVHRATFIYKDLKNYHFLHLYHWVRIYNYRTLNINFNVTFPIKLVSGTCCKVIFISYLYFDIIKYK